MTAPTVDLGKMHGGLRLPGKKRAATSQPILEVPLPAQLIVPLEQHAGAPAQPIVACGDTVLKGEVIAAAGDTVGVPVHAPSSGTVIAIEPRPVARRHGDEAPCIVIDCDGDDTATVISHDGDYLAMQPSDLLKRILDGGIAGLGGAVFPTAQKLMQARTVSARYLILNGVECEPFISCDDVLMRERAAQVVGGAQILMHALQVETCYIAVESDKPEAIERLADALSRSGDDRIGLKQVPTIYPSGAEDQLVQLLVRREVPSGGLPTDVGCLVQNVGTAAAVYDWIVDGVPLLSRVTTVTGDGVASPVNVRARIGTPAEDIIRAAGGYRGEPRYLVFGGPMTGRSVTTDAVPLDKSANCILALSDAPAAGPATPCIRCGDCAAVCPVRLLPQQLAWYARAGDEAKLREFGLIDCIECGCCDLVCPSHIALTSEFRKAKARLRELDDEQARAERARRRFETRNERLAREQQQREAELARQKASARAAGPGAIAEILARKRRDQQDEAQ
jgi:electron transport complex protein RnfC